MIDADKKAREILFDHMLLVSTHAELVETIAQALRDTRNEAIEECAVIVEVPGAHDTRSETVYCHPSLIKKCVSEQIRSLKGG